MNYLPLVGSLDRSHWEACWSHVKDRWQSQSAELSVPQCNASLPERSTGIPPATTTTQVSSCPSSIPCLCSGQAHAAAFSAVGLAVGSNRQDHLNEVLNKTVGQSVHPACCYSSLSFLSHSRFQSGPWVKKSPASRRSSQRLCSRLQSGTWVKIDENIFFLRLRTPVIPIPLFPLVSIIYQHVFEALE